MPTLPPISTVPYDSVDSVLNLARERMLDAIGSLAGEIMVNTAPYIQEAFNGGWRQCQNHLANKGYTKFTGDTILSNCPIVAVTDPALFTYVDWTGYWDGSNLQPTPLLPQDFISPLKMWERQSGGQYSFSYKSNMTYDVDGLRAWPKVTANRAWEWRDEKIWMPGSLVNMDIRLRYARNLGDFVNQGNPPAPGGVYWYDLPVPIINIKSALAWWVCYQVGFPRGDVESSTMLTMAQNETDLLFNRDIRLKQRVNLRRKGRSGRNSGGYSGSYGSMQ